MSVPRDPRALAGAVLLLLLTLAVATPAGAARSTANDDVEFTRAELTDELLAETIVDRQALILDGDPLGHVSWTMGLSEYEDAPAYTSHRVMRVDFGDDGVIELESTVAFAVEPPHAFLGCREQVVQGDDTQLTVVEATADGLVATVHEGGELRTLEAPAIDYTWADVLTSTVWLRAGREAGDAVTYRNFDPETLELMADGVEVQEVLGEGDEREYVCLLRDAGMISGPVRFDTRGHIRGGTLALFEVRPLAEGETPEVERWEGSIADVISWALDRPLGDPTEITGLVLESDDPRAREIPVGPRQEVEHDEESGLTWITVGDAYGDEEAVTPESVRAALRETTEHPIHDPRVKALAEEALSEVDDDSVVLCAMMLIWFVDEYIEDDLVANPLTVKDILDERRGDCSEHALLYVTLARSVGIPARQVSGVVYADDPPRLVPHAWVEVAYEDWWFQYDPSWSEVDLNATHVRLGADDDVPDPTIALTGGLSFTVREVERTVVEDYWED